MTIVIRKYDIKDAHYNGITLWVISYIKKKIILFKIKFIGTLRMGSCESTRTFRRSIWGKVNKTDDTFLILGTEY